MNFVPLIGVLLMVACYQASPLLQKSVLLSTLELSKSAQSSSVQPVVSSTTNPIISSTSEGFKVELTTKPTTVKSIGVTASLRNVQSTKSTIQTRVRSTSNLTSISKTDALYQMANNLLQKEKNWLQTEKWLIDNVYRLRNELGDIKRELSDQKKLNLLLNQKSLNGPLHKFVSPSNDPVKNANFIQDLTSLRNDHSLISQQQNQIIQSTKDNQQQLHTQTDLLKQLTTMVKEQFKSVASISQAMVSLQQINDSTTGNTNQLISKLMYDLSALSSTSSAETEKLAKDAQDKKTSKQQRSINPRILQLLRSESQFEGRTENKLGQLSDEVTSLHSMTINLSKDLADLQKQVIKK